MHYCTKFIALLLTSLLCCSSAFSQNKIDNIQQYTKENGLPSNETYCVLKDRKGYIWIGTDKGVVRYNGNKFQKFELPDNVVFKIKEADDGKIWFFTYTGKLSYFLNEKIYPYKYNDTIQKYAQRLLISDAYIFKDDELLIKSINLYDYQILENGTIRLLQKYNNFKSVLDSIIISKKQNQIVISHNMANQRLKQNLVLLNKISNIKEYKLVNPNNLPIKSSGVSLDKNSNTFIYIKNIFYKIGNDNKVTYKVLKSDIISLYYDEIEDCFYLGLLNKGFVHLNSDLSTCSTNSTLSSETVSGITKDGQGNLWFSTLASGVFFINNTSNTQEKTNWIITTEAQKIAIYDDSSFIFGNRLGLYFARKKIVKKLFSENINVVGDLKMLDNKTLVWAGATNNKHNAILNKVLTENKILDLKIIRLNVSNRINFLCNSSIVMVNPNGLIVYPEKIDFEKLTDKKIKEIYKNDDNSKESRNKFTIIHFDSIFVKNISILNCDNILMGTLNNLYKYNIPSNKASIYIPQTTIFKKGVNYIIPFKNNIQAIAIRFGGLALIKDTTVIANITEQDGLIDNSITYILPDSNKLWLASNKGLSCVTFQSFYPVKYTIKNFGKEVGLGNEIIYQIIRFKKDILAATSKGIFKLSNADSLLALPPKPIPFYMTTIATYLGDTSNITNISLPHNKNRISINFDAIEFTTPLDIEYYYRIVNSDSTWFSISNPQLILQDLSPGTYLVELKATLPKQGRTSEVRQITITVEKPWWLKTISLVAFAIGLIGLLFLFSNWRIKKAKKTAQEKNEIATKMLKLEQTALQAQMNPHFIFNCLTGIQQLMNSNNIDEANEYLVTFSRLIRSTLENSTQEFIVLQDEIDYLKRYISLEEKRLTNELQTSFTIAENISTQSIEIPNMMLQPILENAIRHGIKALENKVGKIAVNFKLINNSIQCIVEDNGIGREASAQNKMQGVDTHKSFGLTIIKQRLQGYSKSYNQNFSIEVIDLQNENNIALGTKVTVHLPIKN